MELELELDPEHPAVPKDGTVEDAQSKSKPTAETVAFDRRRNDRPEAPKPSLLLSLQLKTDKLAKMLFANTTRGMVFVGVQLFCLVLIAWSLGVRYSGSDSTETMEYDLLALQTQLDTLKSQWSDADLRQIEASLSTAESRVFDDYPAFAGWLYDKTEFASRLGLTMNYRIGQQGKTSLSDTLSLPVHMSLKVQEKAVDNAYVRTLEFVRSLIDENRRLEVYGKRIMADNTGMNAVDLDIHVWVRAADTVNSDIEPDDSYNPEVSDVAFIQ